LLGRCRTPGDKLLGPSSLNFGRKETRSGREKKQQLRQRANPRAISAGKNMSAEKKPDSVGKTPSRNWVRHTIRSSVRPSSSELRPAQPCARKMGGFAEIENKENVEAPQNRGGARQVQLVR
jgi:hypothetical protein